MRELRQQRRLRLKSGRWSERMRVDWDYARRTGPQDRRKSTESGWTRLLNSVRLEKGLTQTDVASAAGTTQSAVSLVERGKLSSLRRAAVVHILDKYFGTQYDAELLDAITSCGLLDEETEPELRSAPRPVLLLGSPKVIRQSNRNRPWSKLLNRIRIEKQLTQGDIATAANVNRAYVSRVETGKLDLLSRRAISSVLAEYCGSSFDGELLAAMETLGLAENGATMTEALARLRIR